MEDAARPARPPLLGPLRQTAMTALVAFGLFLPLIGFDTVVNVRNELVLETRWPLLLAIVLTIAGLRFLQLIAIGPSLGALSNLGGAGLPLPLRKMAKRSARPLALVIVAIYPALALTLAGTGAGKWIDNFGIQIL